MTLQCVCVRSSDITERLFINIYRTTVESGGFLLVSKKTRIFFIHFSLLLLSPTVEVQSLEQVWHWNFYYNDITINADSSLARKLLVSITNTYWAVTRDGSTVIIMLHRLACID